MSLARILVPFSSRNYRLFFSGQIVSLLGTWMTQTATVWLVYQLTGSPLWLGIVTLLGQLPAILLSPLGGVWVDRLDRVKLLVVTQGLSMLQSLLLAVFTLTGRIDIWMLTGLAMFQGIITAFDLPTRQSLAPLLAERREDLPAIIGMNSSMFNLARLVGPAIAGVIIAAFGAGWCFLLDGLSYIAVIAAILAMRLTSPRVVASGRSVWHELREGARYALGFAPIRSLILLTGAMGMFGMSFAVLIPAYAQTIFGGDARTLGWLMSASAAGSVLGALHLAGRRSIRGISRTILGGGFIAAAGLTGLSLAPHLGVAMACLLLAGMGGILVFASNNTLMQNLVDEDKRGRAMSIYTVAFLGGMPLGGLLTGAVADLVGLRAATALNAASCVVIVLVFACHLPRLRREARPVLERAGLL